MANAKFAATQEAEQHLFFCFIATLRVAERGRKNTVFTLLIFFGRLNFVIGYVCSGQDVRTEFSYEHQKRVETYHRIELQNL